MRGQPRIRPRRQREEVGPNLDGQPCVHRWERFRGFAICVQPMCGVLTHWDGTLMNRAEAVALIEKLRLEQGPGWDEELTETQDGGQRGAKDG